jgi:hypothetical protein
MITIRLTGHSGRTLDLHRAVMNASWDPIPAIYAFASYPYFGQVSLYFIGETGNRATRFPSHEKWPSAVVLGAMDIYALHFQGTGAQRRDIERDLIHYHKPPLNSEDTTEGSATAYAPSFLDDPAIPANPIWGLGSLLPRRRW